MVPASRSGSPTPAVLGLAGPHAADDLHQLGWDDGRHNAVLWALAGSGDQELALNTLIRVVAGLRDAGGDEEHQFQEALLADAALRVRLMALVGGSTALGDHLAAHPTLWRELAGELPTREEMMRTMLGAVEARPAVTQIPEDAAQLSWPDDPARNDLTTAGTYRAAATGAAATRALRAAYRGLMLRIAAHDLAGTYPTTKRHAGLATVEFPTVTRLLADAADAALTAALAVAVAGVYGEKPVDTRLAVVAMGKCGARELNYISDADVIFVAEPITPKATRLAGEFSRIGSACFFDVDANLRPEGRSGALVRTVDSHVAYYRRWAETWEFQALLKGRPQTGYLPLGERYVSELRPLVWESSQRDSFVADVQSMRARVVDSVPKELKERELKLGTGGLRDVEFAVQLLQLVHGRSDDTLRVASTVAALKALIDGGYVGRDDGRRLQEAYAFLRLLEHRLQLQRFRRTHTLPANDDTHGWEWLAACSGYAPTAGRSALAQLHAELRRLRILISELHSRLFYRPLLSSVAGMDVGTLRLSPDAAKLQLGALGYAFPDRAFEHLTALAAGTSRHAKIQAVLLPTLMDWLGHTADPDAGLLNYRKLSEAARSRTWYLRLLRDEGVVGQRLMHILGTSPYTSELIISSPDFIKHLGDGATGPKLLDSKADTVARSLVAAAARHPDPDKAIAVARSLRRNELARIASADLLGLMDTQTVCRSLSRVWDAVLEAALQAEIRADLSAAGRNTAPARIAVIGMGRLGGAELGYGSDADVMFVAEPAGDVSAEEAIRWAVGICDGLRSRLSKPSADPPLEVDLGLRPEGRSGPVVRTIESYRRYYQQWGETWEFQALLRAAFIAGDRDVGTEFLHMVDSFRYPPEGISAQGIRDMRRMKARVDNERLPRGADPKMHTKLGRGALTDIEWAVQLAIMENAHRFPSLHNTSTLEVLDQLEKEGIMSSAQARTLRDAWLMATRARNALVLVRGRRTDQLPQPGPQLAPVAGAAGWDPADNAGFLEHYLKLTRRARGVVDEVFWGEKNVDHHI